MRTILRMFVIGNILLLTFSFCIGCKKKENINKMKSQLIGTWVSEPTETAWGTIINEYTFRNDLSVLYFMYPSDPDDTEEDAKPLMGRYELDANNGVVIFFGKQEDSTKGKLQGDTLLLWNEDEESEPVVFRKRIEKEK